VTRIGTEEEDITEEALYQQGHKAGYDEGYEGGYAEGYKSALTFATAHPSLMQDTAAREAAHPLRRIVAVQTTAWTHSTWETHHAQLSCGHVEPEERAEAAIVKDIQKRRRIVCEECESDV